MKWFAGCLLLALSPVANAQPWSFENRAYYDPLIAAVRDPHISALVPVRFDRMAMMVENDQSRLGWDIDVGAELPIVGYDFGEEGGVGLWIPIDFHMIEDFVDESAPIVNTDYRFSGMLKYRRELGDNRAFAARLQFGHESTHLGDEFSIHAQQHSPATFERINVSWEYLDLGALYAWSVNETTWNARGGVTMTVPFGDSYYQTGPGSITTPGGLTESKNWWDPYLGLELTRNGALFHETYDLYASSELRWRSVYNYHKVNPDSSEERQASVNLIVGIKKNGTGKGGVGRASPFVRFYRGVNPHGQFRNQKDFTELGIGVRLVR